MIQYSLISLSDLLACEYEEERIIEIFKKFSCQRETDLEDFLLTKAIMYERANIGNSISIAARVVGGEVIVLECREQMFSKFYERQGYKKFYPDLNDKDLYTLYKKVNFDKYWNNEN